MHHKSNTELLDASEAARYLATTPRHLRRLVTSRGLAVVRLGGKRRFRREDLDEFAQRSRFVGPEGVAEENPL